VAPGHNDRRPVARANIAQRDKHIDLPAIELLIANVKLASFQPGDRARVDKDRLTRTANTRKILVDKQRTVVAIKGVLTANERLYMFNPRRVIDKMLERFAGFVDLLEVQPLLFA